MIQKKKEAQNNPEKKRARQLANQNPKVKDGKGYSSKKRRRTLRYVQIHDEDLYLKAKAWAISKLAQEEEEKTRLREEIAQLEKELDMIVE